MSEQLKRSKSSMFYIVGSVLCLMVIGYFLLVPGDKSEPGSDSLGKMQHLAQQVQGMETDAQQKQKDVVQLVDRYQEQTGTKIAINLDSMELGPDARQYLEEQIGAEKDISAKALLKEILKKRDQINDLRDKIADIENRLPAPHIAKTGESHYAIAMAFLTNDKGLEEEYAQKILAKTALFGQLAPGFKVWNFFTGTEYGTSVTQGDAKISPNNFVNREKKKLGDERDKAVTERDTLAKNIKSMELEQQQVNDELDLVSNENKGLAVKVAQLDKQVNSVTYLLDTQSNLKKKGILKKGFLKAATLTDVSPQHFSQSINLDSEDRLMISAADIGVKKIKNVVLYPRFYKKGSSYKVLITPSKKHALLTLLERDKFKSERLVIAVR